MARTGLLPALPGSFYLHVGNGGVFHTAYDYSNIDATDCGISLVGVYWTREVPQLVSGVPSMTIEGLCRRCIKHHTRLLELVRAQASV
jgi:hypothetical protein